MINNIEFSYNNNRRLSKNFLINIEKIAKRKDKDANDYFILGYVNYIKGNKIDSNKYFKLSVEKIDKYTHQFASIYAYKFLAEDMLNKNNSEKAIFYINCAMNNLKDKNYNKYCKNTWDILSTTINTENGRNVAIKRYENILYTDNLLSENTKFFIYSKLSPLYTMKFNYANAIEASIKGSILAKDLGNSYEQAKLTIDLGNIFRALEEYEKALDTIKDALKLNIEDNSKNSLIKAYALLNLSEISLILDNNDRALNYLLDMDKYLQNIKNKDVYNDFNIMKNIILAEIYIDKKEYEKASKYLDSTKILLGNNDIIFIPDKDIYYIKVCAELQNSLGNYDKAIILYKKAIELSKERNNIEYQKINIKKLGQLYQKIGDTKNIQTTKDSLFKLLYFEKDMIKRDYSSYAFKTKQNENIIQKEKNRQTRDIITCLILALIFIGIYIFVKKLIYNNIHDGLTNVYNRAHFNKVYTRLTSENYKFSVVMIDIDNFKILNDKFGHEFGDSVLMDICKVIKKMLNKPDAIYRYGGEEFVIILNNKNLDQTVEIAQNIRKKVSNMSWDEKIQTTISVGVAMNDINIDPIKKADQNLYKSKQTGKNKVTF